LMRRCLQENGRWLAARDYLTTSTDLSWNLLMRGYYQEAWFWTQRALHRAQHTHRLGENLASNAASLLTILGEHQQAEQYLTRARQLAEAAPENRWRWVDLLGRQTLIHLERDDLGAALDQTIRRHHALGLPPQGTAFHMRHFYVFQAYALLARHMRQRALGDPRSTGAAALREEQASLSDLRLAVEQLRRLSGHPTFQCHRLVVEAGLERLQGAHGTAKRLLEEAEHLARVTDNPWASFEIARQRAHLSQATRESAAVESQVKEALRLATEHGWLNRVRWIRLEFPDHASPGAGRTHQGSSGDSGPSGSSPPTTALIAPEVRRLQRHHQALLQVSLTMAAAMDPAHLARVALDQVVRILGAERGHLFLCPEQSEELVHTAGRDATHGDLEELQGYSRSVLETVRVTRQPVVMTSAEEGPLHTSQSIIAHDLRSVVAVPLVMPGRLVGALYLDSRVASGVFGKEDLDILMAIASHIAVTVTIAQAFARQTALAEENEQLLTRLSQQVEELQASRRRITEAEERQRREISELLHGQVQAKLLLVSHRLGDYARLAASDPSAAAELVSAVRKEIDTIRENEVRLASHQLHPSIIRLGLGAALHLLAERFDPQFRVTVDIDPCVAALDDPLENQLPEGLRLVAYRIMEEALGNAAKHSGASTVVVCLTIGTASSIPQAASQGSERDLSNAADETETSRYLVVTVSDNGRGFDSSRLRPGLGLNSLGDRVDQANGIWRITGEPGKGTTLAAWLRLTVIETEPNAGAPTAKPAVSLGHR
ncbi:MAG TPA: GAF domain-containing protein, partial [Chloroflexota bacterium]|nr:GAF domain-containing protein [Chloroflexota bacterium]